MRRRGLVLVVMLGIVLLLASITQAFQNEPDGFRGLKWGDPPGEDMKYIGEDEVRYYTKYYKRKDDKLQMGAAKLESIQYIFYKNQFVSILIETKEGHYYFLVKLLELKFGNPEYNAQNLKRWSGNRTRIEVENISPFGFGTGKLIIYSMKIYNQREADEYHMTKEGLSDF